MEAKSIEIDGSEIFLAQLAGRLRNVRRESGLTQAKAAEMCKISGRRYRDCELGVRAPELDFLMRFCVQFDQEPEFLIFGPRQAVHVLASDTVEMISKTLLSEFCEGDIDLDKMSNMARYAYDNSKAKGTQFQEELKQVRALLG